jgi:hypothetical protein
MEDWVNRLRAIPNILVEYTKVDRNRQVLPIRDHFIDSLSGKTEENYYFNCNNRIGRNSACISLLAMNDKLYGCSAMALGNLATGSKSSNH